MARMQTWAEDTSDELDGQNGVIRLVRNGEAVAKERKEQIERSNRRSELIVGIGTLIGIFLTMGWHYHWF